MRFTRLMTLTLTLAGAFAGQALLADGPGWDNRDTRNDSQDLRRDYRDLRHDYAAMDRLRADIARDQWRLDDDIRDGRRWRVEQDRRDLWRDQCRLDAFERDARADRHDIRRDNQDLRRDYYRGDRW